jgi:hypothetical protein
VRAAGEPQHVVELNTEHFVVSREEILAGFAAAAAGDGADEFGDAEDDINGVE